ncbi:MAG: hypothetical protein JNK69_03765 [Saprospiraceae bacterium]|nr:hypothetical protein [Saprospiraceae bacterium]
MKNLANLHFRLMIMMTFMVVNIYCSQAQNKIEQKMDKAVSATEKIQQKSQKVQNGSVAMNENMQQAGEGIKSTVQNVKAIIKIFDPIRGLHFKNKNNDATENTNDDQLPDPPSDLSEPLEDSPTEVSETGSTAEQFEVPESASYNTDGSANLGNQNNQKYGCYLDMMSGLIMDDVDAAGNTSSVDIIFTATDYYGSAPMYALLTPAYVKNDHFANYYFRGSNYKDANIPVKLWEEVNESEIALTALTSDKFEKIQNNNQLLAVIKQTPAFKDKFESRPKINGKVFAIKTKMQNREAYGLMLVEDQFGTTGASGYLKVRLKVMGFDSNGDGNPDANLYK